VLLFCFCAYYVAACSSLFWCELWSLSNCAIEQFCVAWRKDLRHIMGLPMLLMAVCCRCCLTVCQFLIRLVSNLQSLYCLAYAAGQRLFVQL